jgi:hypothetical protein
MKSLKSACAKEIEAPCPSRFKRRLLLLTSITLWLLIVGIGLSVLLSYENTPGVAAKPSASWPADSQIQRAPGRATLVMLVHPHCPCSRASIGELALLMAQSQGHLTAYVLFLKPAGFSDDWEKTDLWQSAAGIPGVKPVVDYDGAEARRFNAATSGQTVLYDAEGRLLFSGGITMARGHAGDNAGRSAIVSLVNAKVAEQPETPVFGCPLFADNSDCRKPNHERNKN